MGDRDVVSGQYGKNEILGNKKIDVEDAKKGSHIYGNNILYYLKIRDGSIRVTLNSFEESISRLAG